MDVIIPPPRATSRAAHPSPNRRMRAFSLLDVLIVLALISLLGSLAVPAIKQLVGRMRLTTQVNGLLTHMHLARSEAVKRGQPVALCKSPNSRQCVPEAAWHDGWIVFVDPNNNHKMDAGETVIHVHGPQAGIQTRLNASGGGRRNDYFAYRPDGLSGKSGTFTLCDAASPGLARAIIVYRTGRARVSDKSADGARPLSCPAAAET